MVLFVFGNNKTISNLNSLNTNNIEQNGDSNDDSYVSQYVDMKGVGNDNPFTTDIDVTSTLVLPDNKVFFGGENGNWAIEEINDGAPGTIVTGRADEKGYWSSNSITTVFLSSDYSSSSDIILGFDNGYIGFLNEKTKEVREAPGWDQMNHPLVDSKIIKIEFTGTSDTYLYYGDSGQIMTANIINSNHWEIYKMEINNEKITSINDSSDGKVIIGTNKASIYKCDVVEKEGESTTEKIVENLEDSSSINTLTNVSSKIVFAGMSDGKWFNVSLKTKEVVTSGDWGTSDSMNTSLLLPDDKGSEVLVAGDNGYWGIIDTNKAIPEGQKRLINHGNLDGGKEVSTLTNLDEDNNSIFLYSGAGGKWFTEKPIGFVTGFDQTKQPETTLISKDQINFKITTKNDYPNWPIDIKKYKIKATVYDTMAAEDTSRVSTDEYDQEGEIEVKLDSLIPSNTYNELRVQLVETDGKTAIGKEWNTHVSFDTLLGRVTDITDAEIDENSITSNGFDFTINTFACTSADPKKVEPFTINLFAKVDGASSEEIIWTSRTQRKSEDNTKFIVESLSPGVVYDEIGVRAKYEDTGDVGTEFKFSYSKVTTKNIPQSISAHFDASYTSSTGFRVLVNGTAEDSARQVTDGYYVNIKNDDGIDFTSAKIFDIGQEQEYSVEGLEAGKTYDQIKVYLSWDEAGNDKIPNCVANIGKTTIDNYVKEISNASYNTDLTTFNSISLTAKVKAENDSEKISDSYIIQVFNEEESKHELLYYTNPLNSTEDPIKIKIDGLEAGTTYKMQLQLVFASDKTEIGDPFNLDEITTKPSSATGISNPEVIDGSVTSSGFTSRVGIRSEGDSPNVLSYEMVISANVGEPEGEVDTLLDKKENVEAGVGVRFVVTDLAPTTTYFNIKYEIFNDSGDSIGEKQTKDNVTTLGKVNGFVGDSVANNITYSTFDMSINVTDTFPEESNGGKSVEEYWILVYANGETGTGTELWSSLAEDPDHIHGLTKSGVISFTVKGLIQRTEYSDISVSLVDSDGVPFNSDEPIKNTGINLKTKMSPKTKAIIEIGSGSLFIAFIAIIIIIIILIQRRKNAKKDKFAQDLKFF